MARTRRTKIVSRSFYDRDPALVAPELLGAVLVRQTPQGITSGRIVEVEAYLAANDPACHAACGKRSKRNESMFGPPGTAYVYMIHSRWCFNTVTEKENVGSAVLIRAIEPIVGVELMMARRGLENLLELARGPAKMCEAMAIDRSLDRADLTRGEQLWIERNGAEPPAIATSGRVGISAAQHLPLRFYIPGCRFVSKPGWSKRFPGA